MLWTIKLKILIVRPHRQHRILIIILFLSFRHWPFGKLLCHLLPFSQGVSVYVSAFTLMSIAVDRYFVIIFPFKKRMSVKMCVIIIIIIWISGSTLTLPYAIFMQLVEVELEDGRKLRFCEEAWPHDTSRRTFSTCTSVIQFIVPFVIIAFCYSKVCSKLKTRAKFKPGRWFTHIVCDCKKLKKNK